MKQSMTKVALLASLGVCLSNMGMAPTPWQEGDGAQLPDKDKQKLDRLLELVQKIDPNKAFAKGDEQAFNAEVDELTNQVNRITRSLSGWWSGLSPAERLGFLNASVKRIQGVLQNARTALNSKLGEEERRTPQIQERLVVLRAKVAPGRRFTDELNELRNAIAAKAKLVAN